MCRLNDMWTISLVGGEEGRAGRQWEEVMQVQLGYSSHFPLSSILCSLLLAQ